MCFCFPSKSYILEVYPPKPQWRYVRERVGGRVASRQVMYGDKVIDYKKTMTKKSRIPKTKPLPTVLTLPDGSTITEQDNFNKTAKKGKMDNVKVKVQNWRTGKTTVLEENSGWEADNDESGKKGSSSSKPAAKKKGQSANNKGNTVDKGKGKAKESNVKSSGDDDDDDGKGPGSKENDAIGVPAWLERRNDDEWESGNDGNKETSGPDPSDEWGPFTTVSEVEKPTNENDDTNKQSTSRPESSNDWTDCSVEKPTDEKGDGNKESSGPGQSDEWEDWATKKPEDEKNDADKIGEWAASKEQSKASSSQGNNGKKAKPDGNGKSNEQPSGKANKKGKWKKAVKKVSFSVSNDGQTGEGSQTQGSDKDERGGNSKDSPNDSSHSEWEKVGDLSFDASADDKTVDEWENKDNISNSDNPFGGEVGSLSFDASADDKTVDEWENKDDISNSDNPFGGEWPVVDLANQDDSGWNSWASSSKDVEKSDDNSLNTWKMPTSNKKNTKTPKAGGSSKEKGDLQKVNDQQRIPGAWPLIGSNENDKVNSWQGIRGERTEIGKRKVITKRADIQKNRPNGQPPPRVPEGTSSNGMKFWVCDADMSYSLRTVDEIRNSCQPGEWKSDQYGFPFFDRASPERAALERASSERQTPQW